MTNPVLKQADSRLGQAPLSKIKTSLDRLFGGDAWVSFEPETISIELGIVLDELLLDKIQVLQILVAMPETFSEDPGFLLHACDVINNQVADFETVPVPTSLELAYAIHEVSKILKEEGKSLATTEAMIKTVTWILRNEGYSKPIEPFDFIPESNLELGQTSADTADKKKAVEAYIASMENI